MLFLAETVSATVTSEPNNLFFEKMLNNGYAEKSIKITTDSAKPIQIVLSATEPINKWVRFEYNSAFVSDNSPAEFKVMLNTSNASIGTYEGYIIANIISSGNDITVSIITSLDIKTTVEVTDEQIAQASVEEISFNDVEQKSPIRILIVIQNKGNIGVEAFSKINILNSDRSSILKSINSAKKKIPASSRAAVEVEIPNDLAVGKYIADINVYADDMILRKHSLSFNVASPGMLVKEEAKTVKLSYSIVPSGVNWTVVIAWVFILAVIGGSVAIHIRKKK